MKFNLKRTLGSVVAALALVAVPTAGVFAQTANDDTVINALIGSSISVTAAAAVNLNIAPVVGGSQTSASDTVTVATNHSTGYTLSLADQDANTSLVSGGNTITAHTGTHAAPTALANNSWGYAVPGDDFDATYSVLNNATSSASLWAGVPASGSGVTIASSGAPTSGDAVEIWYSAKADTTKPNGTYTDTVVYTATVAP